MSIAVQGKYICDSSGKIIEVILPIDEFKELQRRASQQTGERVPKRYQLPEELSAAEMTRIADHGGAFDWLKDEPDLYSDDDGGAGMKRLKRGDVVLTVFPFADLTAEKRRPALVFNENTELGDVILAFMGTHIPSVSSKTSIVLKFSDADFQKTGLKTNSVIRLDKIATIERRLITRRLERLENERMKTVDRALILALQITHGISEI